MTKKQIISFSVGGLLTLTAVIICSLRWHAWFGNIPEDPYCVAAEPHNFVMTTGTDLQRDRVITWRMADSLPCTFILADSTSATIDSMLVTGHRVASRAGQAVYYQAVLNQLKPARYSYYVRTPKHTSDTISFRITEADHCSFLLFGDIQEHECPNPFSEFISTHPEMLDSTDFMAYVGDVIERPIDKYWQVWFQAMNNCQARVPQLAVPGNHEYLKGLRKTLDTRWTSVFSMPHNGPERFLGHTYYVESPLLRLIFLDTDALQLPSDFLIARHWLREQLQTADNRWRIVVMHHPVHSASKGRSNPLIQCAFQGVLRDADLVFAGHDHNYLRRQDTQDDPLYIVTGTATKQYTPQHDSQNQCEASQRPFYEQIQVTPSTLSITTRTLQGDTLIDQIIL